MPTRNEIPSIEARVRQIVLKALDRPLDAMSPGDADRLDEFGLDSRAAVELMLAIESELGFRFPNRMLERSVFNSIDSIKSAVAQLRLG